VLVDADGRVAGQQSESYPLLIERQGWVEQDPRRWWEALRHSFDRFWADGFSASDVEGIGITGQMHGLVMLDRSGSVIRPAILWNDQRTVAETLQLSSVVGREKILQLTGSLPQTGFTAPKLMWVRNQERPLFNRMWKFLLPKDYLGFLMTGEPFTDVNDASGTSLFDVGKRRWSYEIVDSLGLSPDLLPEVLESPLSRGDLTRSAAELLGLRAGTPVAAGAGDQAAAGIGAGAVDDGPAFINLGTSGVVFTGLSAYKHDPEGRLHAFCHAVPDKWHLMGVMLSAGGALRWFRDALGGVERQVGSLTGQDSYEILIQEAAQVSPGSGALIFLPYLSGERTPHADPFARGVFFGLSLLHGKPHMVRAVLEGVAFAIKDAVEIMKAINVNPSQFRAIGGGSRSGLWRQILADVLARPVYQMPVEDASAYGSSILGMVASRAFAGVETAVDRTVKLGELTSPNGSNSETYGKQYEIYKRLYPALKEAYRSLENLSEFLHV